MGGVKARRLGGQAVRRCAGWCARAAMLASAGALLTAYPANRLTAQVGYPPERSPYRDIQRGRTLILGGGYLSGDRGVVGVGPADGGTATLRFEVPFGKPLAFFLEAGYGRLSRYVADPTKNMADHISGPIKINVGMFQGGVDLMLSGAKSWHHMAPYIGGSGGVIFAEDPPVDSSGYHFGARGILGPEVGIRWYLGRGVHVRTELRWMFWELSYPLAYKQPSPDGSRILDLSADEKEWTDHPWISIGLGWTF